MASVEIKQRMDLHKAAAGAYNAMIALEKWVHSGTLGEPLIGLVKMRASQINGCAFCLDMHGQEARKAGVAQRKLDVLPGWHEAPALYTAQEQAALALTEEMTLISAHGVSDATWQRVQAAFSETEVATLIMAICAINSWNRMAITTHMDLPKAG